MILFKLTLKFGPTISTPTEAFVEVEVEELGPRTFAIVLLVEPKYLGISKIQNQSSRIPIPAKGVVDGFGAALLRPKVEILWECC